METLSGFKMTVNSNLYKKGIINYSRFPIRFHYTQSKEFERNFSIYQRITRRISNI